MGYIVPDGDELRTRFAGPPKVLFLPVPDGPTSVVLVFWSSNARDDEVGRYTRLTFLDVYDFRWGDFDRASSYGNRDDFEFGLIEIIDSDVIKSMISEGVDAHRPIGERFGGVVDERSLKHFRIGFDDHGTYDVVALKYEAMTEMGSRLPER